MDAEVRGREFRTQLSVDVDARSAPAVSRQFGVWLGNEALPSNAVAFVDQSTLRIAVPGTLTAGLYDLRLMTPGGRWATLRGALTVFNPDSSANAGTAGIADAGSSRDGGGGSGGNGSSGSSGGTSSVVSVPPDSGGTSSSTDQAGTAGTNANSAVGGALSLKGGAAGVGGQLAAAGNAGTSGGTATTSSTVQVDGRYLRDVCGNVLLLRGVQQILGKELPEGNDWAGLIDEIAATGANAVRIHPNTSFLGVTGVDSVLARLATHNLIAILNPDSSAWLADPAVKSMLLKYQNRLILDAFGPGYDDEPKFVSDALAAIARVRGYGYQVPLVVLSNNYGRDLPAALTHGAQLVAADPLHRIVLGWDAYWGVNGWFQRLYGMTLEQGIAAAAGAAFPIQIGITLVADSGSTNTMDFAGAMTAAQANEIGWLWWDWYNPYGTEANLTTNGTSTSLLAVGQQVVHTHAASLSKTSIRPCTKR